MFNNIGRKIKGLAKFLFWILVIASIILGAITIMQAVGSRGSSSSKILAVIGGFLVIGGGIVLAWLQNFLLYGYGELIDCNQKMLRILEERNMDRNNFQGNTIEPKIVQQPVQVTPPVEEQTSLQDIVK